PRFVKTGYPVLVGVSRKSMIGKLLGERPVDERLAGSLALATLAGWLGAAIVRVHDVRESVDALTLCRAVRHA
ncbi:MAG: dihydropteroate synthase, partial [Pseudomonadota bacterium]